MPTLTGFPAPRGATSLILGFSLVFSGVARAAEADCAVVAKRVSREVSARPERVLVIVEDTLVVNDTCACEVVKAAIVAAGAGAKLTSQIVFVAISAAPAKATQIEECAKAASPESTAEIDEAVRKAVGDKPPPDNKPPGERPESPATAAAPPESPATTAATPESDAATTASRPSGKEPLAKNPPPPSDDADFGLSPVSIGGVYLVYPGGSGSSPVIKDDNGRLYFIGPDGRRIPLDPPPPRVIQRPRPPGIIIIRPPTPTSSDDVPLEPVPSEDTPIDPTPGPDPA
ncbi:MAG: hypothetical protein ACKV19_25055 [Verrucomicrobiales bacterium]